MSRNSVRDGAVALLIAALLAFASQSSLLSRLDGLSIDLLFWLRYEAFGPLHAPGDSRVAVVAIDEETYRRAPFKDIPKPLWTPQIARVLSAVLDSGAVVVGQDLLLPTSVEPFLRGHDRAYLLALRKGGRTGRLVLGQVQHSAKPISPFPGHLFAAGGPSNLRILNLFREDDGIIRRIPGSFVRIGRDGQRAPEPSFAVELAARALGVRPAFDENGVPRLGDRALPASAERGLLVNFPGGSKSIPVLSFADVAACAEAGQTDRLRKALQGRVVILGTALDVEDRKLASARFVTGPDQDWFAPRCALPLMSELYDPSIVRSTIPGSLIFATAVDNILRNETLEEIPTLASVTLVAVAGLVAAWAAARLMLPLIIGGLGLGSIAWTVSATTLFREGIVVPLIDPIAAAIAAAVAMLIVRFLLTDRARRQVLTAFSYYLPAPVVEEMAGASQLPKLGGEIREVSIFISDIAGFTTVSEGLGPEGTVHAMNEYFNAANEIIEAHAGCTYMYIGDAIFAVFGAPLDDPNHALNAVAAAIDHRDAAKELGHHFGLAEGMPLRVRAGIATGKVLIGNIGSPRRYNYTALGDTVNLAARLESANKMYRTDILISGETYARIADRIACLRLDRVRVQGRDAPVDLYAPLGCRASLSRKELARVALFEEAAALRDSNSFAAARARLQELVDDPQATVVAQNLATLERSQPAAGQLPVFNLIGK